MANKTLRRSPVKKSTKKNSKSKNPFSFLQTSKGQLMVFVLIFVLVGGYFIYQALAARVKYGVLYKQVPAVVDSNDAQPMELGMRFTSSKDGYVDAVRFYKAPTNTGTHTGTLWNADGEKLGTTTFANETASGWQKTFFAQRIPIKAGQIYIISYHTDTGHYSYTNNFFDKPAVHPGDGNPLTGLAGTAQEPNGVYVAGASAFPKEGKQNTNFWVDAQFYPETLPVTCPSGTTGTYPNCKTTSVVDPTLPISPPPVTSTPSPWKLVYEDNFNGTSVNKDMWTMYNSPGHAGNGLRRPEAFSVANGNLIITASMNSAGQIVSGGMANKTSGTYGRFEARVRTEADPTGTMSGVILTWPNGSNHFRDGENDFYETGHAANTRTPFYSFVHWPNSPNSTYQTKITHNADGTQWHDMAMEWTAESIKIFRDGQLIGEEKDPNKIPDVAHKLCVQLDAFSNTTQLTKPIKMYVDYVRVYSKT